MFFPPAKHTKFEEWPLDCRQGCAAEENIMWRSPQPQNLAKTEDSFAGVAVEFWVKASEDAVRLQNDKPGAK